MPGQLMSTGIDAILYPWNYSSSLWLGFVNLRPRSPRTGRRRMKEDEREDSRVKYVRVLAAAGPLEAHVCTAVTVSCNANLLPC